MATPATISLTAVCQAALESSTPSTATRATTQSPSTRPGATVVPATTGSSVYPTPTPHFPHSLTLGPATMTRLQQSLQTSPLRPTSDWQAVTSGQASASATVRAV